MVSGAFGVEAVVCFVFTSIARAPPAMCLLRSHEEIKAGASSPQLQIIKRRRVEPGPPDAQLRASKGEAVQVLEANEKGN